MYKTLFGILSLLAITVFGSSAVFEDEKNLYLTNDNMSVALAKEDFSLQSLKDNRRDVEYVARPGHELFIIKGYQEGEAPPAWYTNPRGIPIAASDLKPNGYEQLAVPNGAGWRLRWKGNGFDQKPITVTMDVILENDARESAWTMEIVNDSARPLQDIWLTFGGLGSANGKTDEEYIGVPAFSGVKGMAPRKNSMGEIGFTDSPGMGLALQLFSYCDNAGGGLYLATHDAGNYRKSFFTRPGESGDSFTFYVVHFADTPAANGRWKLPYPVMLGPIDGDWYDAAKRYRQWAISQPRWSKSLAERDDIPEWFQQLTVWFQGDPDPDKPGESVNMKKFADRLLRLRELLGEDYGFHWYIWQKFQDHDYNYPDYMPARPGFAEALRETQAAGVHGAPYINLQLCEVRLPIWSEGGMSNFARLDYKMTPYLDYGIHGKDRDLQPMCVSNPEWRQVIFDQTKQMWDQYQPDALYYDETYAFPSLCFSQKHAHDWLGGSWHADGIAQIHRNFLEYAGAGTTFTIGENMGESYIDTCAALLNAHSDMRVDTLPIFQTVYSDRTTEIGVFVNQSEIRSMERFASKLAFNLIRGRQLGWLNFGQFDLTKEEFRPQLELLKSYCAARRAGWKFLYAGEMLRAPDLTDAPSVTRCWEIWPTFQEEINYPFPVIQMATYRAPDGTIGLIAANHTDKEQTVRIPWNAKDWGISVGQSVQKRQWLDGVWTEAIQEKLPESLEITLPPWAPAIITIEP